MIFIGEIHRKQRIYLCRMPTSDLTPLREKEKVNLTCEARGYPEPQVRYVKGIVGRDL